MHLGDLLDLCRTLEGRTATIYRSFAAAARHDPPLCALWTELARQEEEHARSLADARAHTPPPESWRTDVEGWEEALVEVEERLTAAELLPPGASPDQQLAAALDLELSELDGLRHTLLAVTGQPRRQERQLEHASRFAETASRLSSDPDVMLRAALLRARARLHPSAA